MKRFKTIYLIPVLSILGALAIGATIQRATVVLNFNAGELSPQMEGRADFAKYNSGARELQNMIVRSQGPVTRRPGTKYIAEVKDSNDPARIIPFEYSTSDAYIIEMGDGYLRFYRNGAQVTSGGAAYEVNAPWDANDLFEVQFAQDAQVMRFVHPDYPPYKLTRNSASHTDWTLAAVDFNNGPFLDENEDKTITITPSGVTGSITLTATDDIWDANHDGALWQVSHLVDSNSISGTFWGAWTAVSGDVKAKADEDSDGTYECNSVQIKVYRYQEYTVTTAGYWSAKFVIQRSYDGGTTWDDVKAFAYALNGNVLYTGSEQQDDAYYRVRIEDQIVSTHMRRNDEGICQFTVATDSFMRHGAVEITEVNDANFVSATVKTELASTDATWRWAEGAWSTYRGWPRTIEFHEQRCCYGGSTSWPQTIWASITASQDTDYDDFDAGEGLAADAWTYVLPGMNPIQWLVSAEYLMVGTTEGVGRLGAPDKPIDPTWPPIYRIQARNGCDYLDAVAAIDAILYVERGGQSIREVTYTYASDRYVAPDMTILAEHIARGGITQIDFAERPDPILWCVRADGVLLSFTYQKSHEVLAWARHITGQDPNDMNDWDDFESVAVIPGTSNRADGTAREDDEVWVVVKRTVDSNEVRYIEQFQSLDWGDDPNYCWFVDCGLGDSLSSSSYEGGEYPTLQELDSGDIPSTPETPSTTTATSAVSNATELQAMSGTGKYYLTADIDLAGVTWTPIVGFKGILDGNGFTISNLSFTATLGQSNIGLISTITATSACQIYDLTFEDCTVTGSATSENVAILCGKVDHYANGILFEDLTFTRCSVFGDEDTGVLFGLADQASDIQIFGCTFTDCEVEAENGDSGFGILAGNLDIRDTSGACYIVDCNVVGGTIALDYTNGNVGGLIGHYQDRSTLGGVYNCSSTAEIVTADTDSHGAGGVGGLFGKVFYADVVGCYATGSITLTANEQGFVGGYSFKDMGGLIGQYSGPGEIVDCYATGDIILTALDTADTEGGAYMLGGLIGEIYVNGGTITRCYATGDISLVGHYDAWSSIGGFIGMFRNECTDSGQEWVIERSWSEGDISIEYGDERDETAGSYNAGAYGGAGGFIGVMGPWITDIRIPVTIENCYAWGSISFDDDCNDAAVGGFLGAYAELYDPIDPVTLGMTTTITNCYVAQTNISTGSGLSNQLPTGTLTYGFYGYEANTPVSLTVSDTYYDEDTSDISQENEAAGHDTDWMQTKGNYEDAGWDFNDIWVLDSTVTDSNTFEGADALIGESVCVYADCRPIGSVIVDANGEIDVNAAYSTVIVGLNYYSILETMPLVDAETIGRPTSIKSVAIDFLDTMGARVGSDFDHTANWKFFDRNYLMGSARDPNDGTVALPYRGNTMATGDVVRIYGTTNYNGIWTLAADTNNVELRISDTYTAEDFDGTETVDPNEAIEPYTGYKPLTGYTPFLRGMTRQPVIYLYQWEPIPMTIRSITANKEITFE